MVENATAGRGVSEQPAAVRAPTLCAAFQMTVDEHGDRVALRTPGDEVGLTWADYAERVRQVAAGLASIGVGRGDSFGVMLINRPEFHIVDAAAMHVGAAAFSAYNTSTAEQIAYVVSDAENRVMVTERAFLERVLEVQKTVPELEHVIVVDGPVDGAASLEGVIASGDPGFELAAAGRAIETDDLLTLIYTSGTTGPPKGVQLTHGNMLATLRGIDEKFPQARGAGRLVSYLPMAHVAERWFTHYAAMVNGDTVTCVPDPAAVVPALADARPTRFLGVPRVWEKAKAALEAAFAAEPDSAKREATRWALDVGRRRVAAEQAGEQLSAELRAEWARADELVCAKIRARLGLEKCEIPVVGAAPTPVEVLEFFHALGLPLIEGWAMSETAAGGVANPSERIKLGTVGTPLPGLEVKLAEDGELLVRGPMVMRGYRNMPDKTAEVLGPDGWLHTGDVAEIDADGYVKIVDRKKELIINAAGKNMSPANIEAKLKSAGPLIGQAIAIGDGRAYNTALLTPDPDAIPAFAKQEGIQDTTLERLIEDPKVIAAVQAEVERANEALARVEQIKRFRLLATEWQPGGDELTPTMKLKRKPIAEKYRAEIEALYER